MVKLCNVCQGGVDVNILWTNNFNIFISALDAHRFIRELAALAQAMIVSKDDHLICAKSEKLMRSEVVNHLK